MDDSQFRYTRPLVRAILASLPMTSGSLDIVEFRVDVVTALRSIPYPYWRAIVLHEVVGLGYVAIELELLGKRQGWAAGRAMVEIGLALLLSQLNGEEEA